MQDIPIQSNTKPHTQNQDLHDKAVKILLEMAETQAEMKAKSVVDAARKSTEKARMTRKEYNERRKAKTAVLRPVLTDIWKKLENGETVGGYTTKEEWCKKVGITIRWCQKVIRDGGEVKKSLRFYADSVNFSEKDGTISVTAKVQQVCFKYSSGDLTTQCPGSADGRVSGALKAVEQMTAILKSLRIWGDEAEKKLLDARDDFYRSAESKKAVSAAATGGAE
jgi:hypothetical protein